LIALRLPTSPPTALDATRVGRDAGRIADEVISHLTAIVNSEVKVTLEIEAHVPNGFPEKTVWTVTGE
jgi:hypothetical protein